MRYFLVVLDNPLRPRVVHAIDHAVPSASYAIVQVMNKLTMHASFMVALKNKADEEPVPLMYYRRQPNGEMVQDTSWARYAQKTAFLDRRRQAAK